MILNVIFSSNRNISLLWLGVNVEWEVTGNAAKHRNAGNHCKVDFSMIPCTLKICGIWKLIIARWSETVLMCFEKVCKKRYQSSQPQL